MTPAAILAFAFVVVVVGLAARPADARQQSDYHPDFDAADLRVLVAELGLDVEQRAKVKSRIEAYGIAFRESARDFRKRIFMLRVTMREPGEDMEAALRRTERERDALLADWAVDRERLRNEFLLDVRGVLTDEQVGNWPTLEIRLRRDTLLGRGQLSGESLDLFRAVRDFDFDTDPSPPEAVTGLLEAYAIELDAALRARHAAPGESGAETDYDPAHLIATRRKVRDVNLDYAARIGAELSPEKDASFRAHVNRMAFPQIYRRTRAERRVGAAVKLSANQGHGNPHPDLVALEAEYLVRITELRAMLREAVRQHEPAQHQRRLEQTQLALEDPARDGDLAQDPIRAGFEDIRALDREVMTRLRALLTPEQTEAVFGRARRGEGEDADRRPRRTTVEDQGWVMEAFDADGDGRLNAEELEALREYLRSSRRKNEQN